MVASFFHYDCKRRTVHKHTQTHHADSNIPACRMCREAKKSKIVLYPNDSRIKASKKEGYCRVVAAEIGIIIARKEE